MGPVDAKKGPDGPLWLAWLEGPLWALVSLSGDTEGRAILCSVINAVGELKT